RSAYFFRVGVRAAVLPRLGTEGEHRETLSALAAFQIPVFPEEGHVRGVEDVRFAALGAAQLNLPEQLAEAPGGQFLALDRVRVLRHQQESNRQPELHDP